MPIFLFGKKKKEERRERERKKRKMLGGKEGGQMDRTGKYWESDRSWFIAT